MKKIIYAEKLELPAVHYYPDTDRDIVVVWVFGMVGTYSKLAYSPLLGRKLADAGIGYIATPNRGVDVRGNQVTVGFDEQGKPVTKDIKEYYPSFARMVSEVGMWVKEAIKRGYKRIVLAGHSLGVNKMIGYLSQDGQENVGAAIFVSPPDLVGLAKKYSKSPDYETLVRRAQKLKGKKNSQMGDKLWGQYRLDANLFLELFTDNAPGDRLPILRNPDIWYTLARISVPILAIVGELDDIAIRGLDEDMKLLEKKANAAPSFTLKTIRKAGHNYKDREENLASVVLDWIRALLKRSGF